MINLSYLLFLCNVDETSTGIIAVIIIVPVTLALSTVLVVVLVILWVRRQTSQKQEIDIRYDTVNLFAVIRDASILSANY